jgi:alanyl-tRNA synthetase
VAKPVKSEEICFEIFPSYFKNLFFLKIMLSKLTIDKKKNQTSQKNQFHKNSNSLPRKNLELLTPDSLTPNSLSSDDSSPNSMTPDTLRTLFLDFYQQKNHAIIPSSGLVPQNDPTTLFTSSGMQPMMPYLLGAKHPAGTRIVDSQLCFRSQDIEEVGDTSHTTFFEMLGNWSLGDYFKNEQLTWFFEFLVDVVGLPPEKLFVTVFSGNEELSIPPDEEAVAIWKKLFLKKNITASAIHNSQKNGLQDGKIFYYSESKNWWSRAGVPQAMPIGEIGGPDSEVFFDFGAELNLHEKSQFKNQPCHVNCDCGRFLEIGNSVFMTYQRTSTGFTPLSQKNIDFGGGLERILAAYLNSPDIFTTDFFTPIIKKLELLSGLKYASHPENTQAFRVIADHVRAGVMLAGEGVFPSNKEQGYFVRRLLRRAIRYAKKLGIESSFLADLVPTVLAIYQKTYPDHLKNQEKIAEVFDQEEKKFAQALVKGLKEIEKITVLTAETAFYLYETYGFPFELTQEIAQEKDQNISALDFATAKQKHAHDSRVASAGKFKGGLAEHSQLTTKYHTATHLLHSALRSVLGAHVEQQGSNITNERLRFDFSHPRALTDLEKKQVVKLMNSWVQAKLPVTKKIMPKTEALKSGAIAFFKEKYPDQVTVYTIGVNDAGPAQSLTAGWISKELCGGPHVSNSAEIGELMIQKEQSVSAGIRRVYVKLA